MSKQTLLLSSVYSFVYVLDVFMYSLSVHKFLHPACGPLNKQTQSCSEESLCFPGMFGPFLWKQHIYCWVMLLSQEMSWALQYYCRPVWKAHCAHMGGSLGADLEYGGVWLQAPVMWHRERAPGLGAKSALSPEEISSVGNGFFCFSLIHDPNPTFFFATQHHYNMDST